MLIEEPSLFFPDPILVLLAELRGARQTREIIPGVYEVGHFGSSALLPDYEHYPLLDIGPYGVCDSYEQVLERCPELVESQERQFVITVTAVCKKDQPAEGGWRWHKWGEYIGVHCPTCEYLHDEPVVEQVYVYHIYEKQH